MNGGSGNSKKRRRMTTLKCSFNVERFLFADIILLTYKVSRKFCYNKELQSNLSTTITLGTPPKVAVVQRWLVLGGFSIKIGITINLAGLSLAVVDSSPLLL